MNPTVFISALALVVSVASSLLGLWQARRIEALGRMPVLTIYWDNVAKLWLVRNVGSGPAFNVVVAQQTEDGLQQWYGPVLLPAIPAQESFSLSWLTKIADEPFSLGVRYSDFRDVSAESDHFSFTTMDRSSVYPPGRSPSWAMPKYNLSEIKRYWQDMSKEKN